METSQLFLSYSRKELYFAEAVALHLQGAGIKTWFDLQQLEPGCDWNTEIKRGLDLCDGLVLLVSRGAAESPYVDDECKHALDNGKPIYALLFEPISPTPIVIDHDEGKRSVHLQQYVDKAAAVIDARTNFAGTMARLTDVVQGRAAAHDPVPELYAWDIPTRLPLAVAWVGLSMALLTALMAIATVQSLSINLLLALGCGLVTGWLANRTWAFLRRESYRDARLALIGGAAWSALYVGWLLPVILVGLLLSLLSPDIHRYSPITQGLRQRTRHVSRSTRRRQAQGFGERVAVFYGRLNGFLKALIVVISGLVLAIAVLALLVNLFGTSRQQQNLITILPNILLFVAVSAPFFVGHFVLNRRYRHLIEEGLGQAGISGLTYAIISDGLDENIASQVSTAMQSAGHRQRRDKNLRDVSPSEADIVIVVLTDNLSASVAERTIDPLLESGKRLIFIVAAALGDAERFRRYAHYQWVDFRRQMPGSLDAMAEDLLIFGADIVSHSFGTRQTPQSFDMPILPIRVAGYVGLQYFAFNFSIVLIVGNALTDALNFNPLLYAVFVGISLVVGMWVVNRVVKREITTDTILNINLVMGILSLIATYTVQLTSVPDGMRIDGGRLFQSIAANVVGLVIGYVVGRGVLRGWLGGWLPTYVPFSVPFPGFQRDWALWRRNLLTAALVATFTFILLAPSIGNISQQRAGLPIAQLISAGNSPIIAGIGISSSP
jgi:hypothetical protein